jgi:hypothetical protein
MLRRNSPSLLRSSDYHERRLEAQCSGTTGPNLVLSGFHVDSQYLEQPQVWFTYRCAPGTWLQQTILFSRRSNLLEVLGV